MSSRAINRNSLRNFVYAAAAMVAVPGFYFIMVAPIAVLAGLGLSGWPLLLAKSTLRTGSWLTYSLMIVLMSITTLALLVVSALGAMNKESGVDSQGQELAMSMFFFTHSAMILALWTRFTKADDREMVSTGERVTISLLALWPLALMIVALMVQFLEWITRQIS